VAAWRTVALGDALTFQRGFDITKAEQRDGPYPVISSSGPKSTHSEFKARGPGVIIGRKGSLGTVFYSEGSYWPHDTTLWVKDFHGNDARFAYYFLQTMFFERLDAGASNPSLNRNHLHTIPVRWPVLPVQQRIAGILSAYDELIENSQQRIRILESMARAFYREWFVHFRFPGHESVPRVASPLGEIPQGWEVVSINDVCQRVTDGSHSSPRSVVDGLPMASSKDMHDWGLTLETCRFITREDFDDLVRNGCKPMRGDVLVTKDGANYLKYIFVNRAEQDVVLLSSIAILRPNARINPHLLAAILRHPENKDRLKNYVTGAAIPRIILKDFKRFQFVLPSVQVQTKWAQLAEPMSEMCWCLVDTIRKLRHTRDLLLPRLLSGQIEIDGA
jgi:type I restriction enzyme S subunit